MNNKAFTLIELLVVVLIIGILAAVALPQYQVAVAKTRVMKLAPFARAIQQAAEAYHMANGEYTEHLDNLDIDMPTGYTSCPGVAEYKCYAYSTYRCMISGNSGFCTDTVDNISISVSPSYWVCWTSEAVGSIGDKVCKSISGGATRNQNNAYVFNRN